MPKVDSIDKIVTSYFACVAAEPFTYKGKLYEPKDLYVSPLLFRGYTCPAQCGACCSRFSLDYIKGEPLPYALAEREIEFNGYTVRVWSDMQETGDHHCRNLDREDGRCLIHGVHPFSCDFELIRFMTFANKENALTQKLYGRAHAMLRIDGERGAQCDMTSANKKTVQEVGRKLRRLRAWCAHFKLAHRVTPIIEWAERGPWSNGLLLRGNEVLIRAR